MYNPEVLYFNESDFAIAEEEGIGDLQDSHLSSELSEEILFGEEEAIDEGIFIEEGILDESAIFGEEEIYTEEESFDEAEIFDEAERINGESISENREAASRYNPNEQHLVQLISEINHETSRLNESEATEYMENKMAEFLPALAAALPTIITLAPHAINAISSIGSLIKKEPPKPTPAPKPKPVATRPAQQVAPAPQAAAPVPAPVANDGSSLQVLQVLTDLIQSPKFLEMLTGMLAGKMPTITANSGQQISGANVLGVISSLAGSLAGGQSKATTESLFPEYIVNQEGTFLIDPQNALQEAELILDLIN